MWRTRGSLAAVFLAIVVLLGTWGALRASATPGQREREARRERRDRRDSGSTETEQGESENIEARVLDYLRRHGDDGRIDPERQRQRVAAEYARYRKEIADRRPFPAGIGGTNWVSLGPTNGSGRMTALAFVPGAPNTILAGSASGGVWKSSDAGTTWAPLTEGLHDLSVGALAVAPSNPSIVYLGSGEGGLSFIPGIGFLKSSDGGANWILPPSVLATSFYRILVHPADANELVVGTNAGAFRSTDGGATWTNVISHTAYGDVPDMVRDPTDPRVLYATTWCAVLPCTFRTAHVLKSADGGVTWSDRSAGLPSTQVGRIERTSIAISPSNPQVLYAARGLTDLVTTGSDFSHIYKTTDGGTTWTDLPSVIGNPSNAQYMGGQSYYDNTIVVSPNNSSVVFAGGIGYVRSSDAGASFTNFPFTGDVLPHPDCHDLKYQGSRLWIANDGGIWSSDDDGRTVTPHNDGLVTRQFYAIASDPTDRNRIIAGSQDNGTMQRIESSTAWRFLEGGDGIGCAIHPLSPEVGWVSYQGNSIERTRALRSPTQPALELVRPPFEDDERDSFLTVVKLDTREPETLYTGSSRVWKSRDGGDTWQPLPTTTSDGSVWSATTTIVAVALPSGDSPNILIAKGKSVFRSADAGQTWAMGRGLPNAAVNHVEIDPRDPSIAYACIATTTGPSVFRSADGGLTWTASASGLPPFAAQVLRVDPTDSSDLFCGTDVGAFRSTDRGATWTRFGTNLPSASIHDVEIFEDGSLLRVGTYGRGVWELAVPPTGNTPPAASITAPAGPITVTTGVPVTFQGSVGDPDAGDTAIGTWFFPDDASSMALASGGGSAQHTFRRGGSFPVALAARDSHGARAAATVVVSVRESFDACAAPAVIPGAGPFPYSIAWNNEVGTTEATDPADPCLGGQGRSGSVWFAFTPAVAGSYSFTTCTAVNTALSFFTGPACGPYTPLPFPCNPIGGDTVCGEGGTSVTIAASAGQTLRIEAGGVVDANVGPVRLTVAPAGVSTDELSVGSVGGARGSVSGGNAVVIMGSGFEDGATVSFGGVPATDVAVLASMVITARTPPHAAGPVDVAVTVSGSGTATLGSAFRYEVVEAVTRAAPAPPRKRSPPRRVEPR